MRSAIAGGAAAAPLDDFSFSVPQIKAVSYSRMKIFEECKFRAFLAFARKLKENKPPEGVETAGQRGKRVHKAAEHYITGETDRLIPELANFTDDFESLRARYNTLPDTIEVERMWCFNGDWEMVPWNAWDQIWMRIKQDVVVRPEENKVVCIDIKTGKKVGNEIPHHVQLQCASVGAVFKFPNLEQFILENWYTDQDILHRVEYTRAEVMAFYKEIVDRLLAVTTCTSYTPSPSVNSCRFCPYKTGSINQYVDGTGECPYAHRE